MKTKCFIFVLFSLIIGVSGVFAKPQFSLTSKGKNQKKSAQTLCAFKGSADCVKKSIQLKFIFPDGGRISLVSTEQSPDVISFEIFPQGFKFLLFNITTRIVGTARIVERPDSDPFVRGVMEAAQSELSKGDFSNRISGNFEIEKDKIFLKQCTWEGLTAEGYFTFVPPYDTDLTLTFNNVLLADLFSWLGQEKIYTQGDLSGQIDASGFLNRLALKGNLSSSGQIADFRYDSISARFEGVYPIIKLTETGVTAEGGVSFNLEGTIDLSKDFKEFSGQLEKMTALPLIRETNVDREWTIRRDSNEKREGETEFKYRLRKEREISGVEEQGTLTIQRSIKF